MKRRIKQTVSLLLALALICVLLPGSVSAANKDVGLEIVDLTGAGHTIIVDGPPHQMDEESLREYRAFSSTMGYLSRTGMIRYAPKDEEAYFTGDRIDLDLDGCYDIAVSLEHGDYTGLCYEVDPETRLSGEYPIRLNSEDRSYLNDDPKVELYYSTLCFQFPVRSGKDNGTEHMDLSLNGYEVIVDGPPHQIDAETLREFHALSATISYLVNTKRLIAENTEADDGSYGKERFDLDRDGHFDVYSVVEHGLFTCLVFYADPETNLRGSYTLNLTRTEQAYLDNSSDSDGYYSGLRFDFPIFLDAKPGQYFYKPVRWAVCFNPQITAGSGEGLFGPGLSCTREQIVTFLWKAAGAPEPESSEDLFLDVKPGKYYTKAVRWAVEQRITGGVGDGKFGVGEPCTREQAMTFLWKACGSPPPKYAENPFTDVQAGKYYYYPVLWASMYGITGGTTPTTFGVGESCTRGQIVTFLYKAAQFAK